MLKCFVGYFFALCSNFCSIASDTFIFNLTVPVHYCIFVQDNQEKSLEILNNLHNESEKKINDLKILINSFVKDNKDNKQITDLVYMENFLDSLRQVEYGFSEFMEAEKHLQLSMVNNDNQHHYFFEKKTAAVLTFFFNAFLFMKKNC